MFHRALRAQPVRTISTSSRRAALPSLSGRLTGRPLHNSAQLVVPVGRTALQTIPTLLPLRNGMLEVSSAEMQAYRIKAAAPMAGIASAKMATLAGRHRQISRTAHLVNRDAHHNRAILDHAAMFGTSSLHLRETIRLGRTPHRAAIRGGATAGGIIRVVTRTAAIQGRS